MKQEWRLIIENEPISAYENMAIDTALQSHCDQPVLRFYTWKPASVSIGRFQNLYDEVNINYCKENNKISRSIKNKRIMNGISY